MAIPKFRDGMGREGTNLKICVPSFRDRWDGHGNSNLSKVWNHEDKTDTKLVNQTLVSLQLRRMLVGRDDHNFMHAVGCI